MVVLCSVSGVSELLARISFAHLLSEVDARPAMLRVTQVTATLPIQTNVPKLSGMLQVIWRFVVQKRLARKG